MINDNEKLFEEGLAYNENIMSENLTRLKLLNENPIDYDDDKKLIEKEYNFFPHDKVIDSLKDTIIDTNINTKIVNKVILLSGQWGTGKTSILNQLENQLKEKLFIKYDAWSSNYDMLLKDFIRFFFHKTEQATLKKAVDTVQKGKNIDISKISIAIYLFIILIIPIFKDIFPKYIENNIVYFIAVITFLLLLTISKEKLLKHLLPFINETREYTEYSEHSDITPRKVRDLLKKFEYEYNKEIIIIIDNLDRLSEKHQRTYLDALYVFIDELKRLKENIWFIIAIDKKEFKKNSNIDLDFFDKISPYEISLAKLSPSKSITYLELLLKNQPYELEIISNKDINFFILFYQYILEGDFPQWILQDEIDEKLHKLKEKEEDKKIEKYIIDSIRNKYKNRFVTIRTNKKIYNKMCIYFNSWNSVYKEKEWLLFSCFQIAVFEVLEYMNILDFLLDQNKSESSTLLNDNKISEEEKKENNLKQDLIDRWVKNEQKDLIIRNILAGHSVPTKEEISTYYDTTNFINYLQDQFKLFGYYNKKLNNNIRQGILDKYNIDDKKYDSLLKLYKLFKDISSKDNAEILTPEFCDSLLFDMTKDHFVQSYESKSDWFGSKRKIILGVSFNNNINSIVLFYILSSHDNDKMHELIKLIELLLKKGVCPRDDNTELDQKGQFLLKILQLFNGYPKEFNRFKKLHKIILDNIYILITGNKYNIYSTTGYGYSPLYNYHWKKLDLSLRKKIWKLIDTNSISQLLEYINQHTDKLLSETILLLELYMYSNYDTKDMINAFNTLYQINNNKEILCIMLLNQRYNGSNLVILDDTKDMLNNVEIKNHLSYLLYELYHKKLKLSDNIYKLILKYISEDMLILDNKIDEFSNIITNVYLKLYNSKNRDIIRVILKDIFTNYDHIKNIIYPGIKISHNTVDLLNYIDLCKENI